MLVAARVGSRVVNLGRTVLPFATWVVAFIQLGYHGYNLYQMYQRYVAQEQWDARQGIRRSFEEVIEMVVRPKRKKRPETENVSATVLEDPTLRQSDNHNVVNSSLAEDNNPNTAASIGESCSSCKGPVVVATDATDGAGGDDDEITIVHDSRNMMNVNNKPLPADNLNNSNNNNVLDDENESMASTSLESTDSNNGIIRDMYAECFICATSLDNPNKPVATLPFCLHPFHRSCLDGVLKWHQKCPVCDFHIFTPI